MAKEMPMKGNNKLGWLLTLVGSLIYLFLVYKGYTYSLATSGATATTASVIQSILFAAATVMSISLFLTNLVAMKMRNEMMTMWMWRSGLMAGLALSALTVSVITPARQWPFIAVVVGFILVEIGTGMQWNM